MQMQAPIPISNRPNSSTTLNITAPTVVVSRRATLVTVTVSAPGSAGSLTINDNTILTGNSAANQIMTAPFSALASSRAVLTWKWNCANGIVVSSVPTGAVIAVAFQ